jgi:MATE family multidrug resistance protein
LLACIPLAIGFVLNKPVLVWAFGEDIGFPTSTCLSRLPPFLVLNVLNYALQRGFQAQRVSYLSTASAFVGLLVCPFANYWLTHSLVGAANAMIVTMGTNTIAMLLLARFHPKSKLATWPVITGGSYWSILTDRAGVREILDLGLPSVVAVCAEWWAFELLLMAVASYGRVALATAITISFNIVLLMFSFVMGVAGACSVRVGNALGGGDAASAVCWSRLAIRATFSATLWDAFWLYLVFGRKIARVYTMDEEVLTLLDFALPAIALLHCGDGFQVSWQQVYRGCGEQKAAARATLTCLWVIGLPTGLLSTHFASDDRWRVVLALLGFSCGLGCLVIWLRFGARRWDWIDKAEVASRSASS